MRAVALVGSGGRSGGLKRIKGKGKGKGKEKGKVLLAGVVTNKQVVVTVVKSVFSIRLPSACAVLSRTIARAPCTIRW